MKDMLWLIRNIGKVAFSSKKSLFLYFGLPLVGVVVSLLLYGGANAMTTRIGIVNQDSQALTSDTVKFMQGLEHSKVTEIQESEISDQLTSGSLDAVLVLEAGFGQSLLDGKPDHIRLVSIKGAQITAYIKSYLYSYADNVAAIGRTAKGDKAAFDRLYSGYREASFKLTANTVQDSSKTQAMTYQTVGFLIMFMLFSAVNLSEMILREKHSRTYFRLLSSPILSRQYVASNVAVNIAVMTLQILITLVMMRYVFHIDPGVPIWQMFVLMLFFALTAIGLSLAIVAFARNTTGAGAIQNLIITPSCLLAGCFFPAEIMPATIQKIAEFLPQHWLLDGLTRLQQGDSFGSLYLNMLILIAFALAFFLLAIYKFGKSNDTRTFV